MSGMKIGLGVGELSGSAPNVEEIVGEIVSAEGEGFETAWLAQVFGTDALTDVVVAGTKTSKIKLGTAVVPTWPRHPMVMAQQAITTNVAVGGRLRLGIGLSHKPVIEAMFGIPFEKPAAHTEEYLQVLTSLVRGGAVSHMGEQYRVNGTIAVNGAAPFPIYTAALGPRMLKAAGKIADGTVTWMTGRKTIESHISPTIKAAAEEAERPAPSIIVGLPVAVCDDVPAAQERASRIFAIYPTLPSYRAMLDREGIADASGLIVAGDESAVESQLNEYVDAGATEFCLVVVGVGESSEERAESEARTRALLAQLNG